MTPATWILRASNLAAALAAAWLGARGRAVDFAAPLLVFACVAAVEGALAFSGRPAEPRLKRWVGLGASIADATLIVWLSFWSSQTAGVFDLAYLVPAVLTALEYGPVAGALSGLVPAALTAAVLTQGLSAEQRGFALVALARAL
ncbi:MAG: hypothetical protein HY079_12130, partial [Elusimicrobia bacterium]|nr:hypothetical protein [Elusimicrobiota bacterium]